MTDHATWRLSLGSYLAGALPAPERVALEEHLRECPSCQQELAALAPLPVVLTRLAPEDFLVDEEPAAVPDRLLEGVAARLAGTRERERRDLRRWRVATASLAAAVVAIVAGLGIVALRGTPSAGGRVVALRSLAASASLAGTVSLASKPWGTEISLSARGLPASGCVAVLTEIDGTHETLGHWGPTPDHQVVVPLATDVRVARIRTITVETTAGTRLLTTTLTPQRA